MTMIAIAATTPEQRRAANWLTGPDTGASSQALFARMTGAECSACRAAPSDPASLGRCLRLLRLMPGWRARLLEMRDCGPAWDRLVPHWTALAVLLAGEAGMDWDRGRAAPLTFAALQRVLATGEMP